MSAKRILIITNRVPYPLNDGGNLAVNAMIEGYHHAGMQVYVLAMNTTKHPVAAEVIAEKYAHLHAFETVDVDNRVTTWLTVRNYFFSKEPNHVARFSSTDFADKLTEIVRSFKPDIVQVESVFLANYMSEIKSAGKPLTVLRLHNIEYEIWKLLARESKGFFRRTYFKNLAERIRKFESNAWKQFDVLLPITENDGKAVKKYGLKNNVIVTPFGIDTSKIKPSAVPEQWNGYHLGAMDWIPNVEGINWFIKRTWSYLHNLSPDFKFYFAGRNMPEYFKELNIPGVYCMGEVPDAEEFIADKKILIVPLRSAGGIRVKILEAMAAGKLVISTDIGMQGIDATPETHYLAANRSKEFSKAVNWCRMYRKDAEEIAAKGMELVKAKYDNAVIMADLIDKLNNTHVSA